MIKSNLKRFDDKTKVLPLHRQMVLDREQLEAVHSDIYFTDYNSEGIGFIPQQRGV